MLEVRLLGQFDLRLNGAPVPLPSRPSQVLLAYLVLTGGTKHPRERLAGLIWPDSSGDNARKNLRQALWRLRKTIGDAYVEVGTASVGLNPAADFWSDVALLEDRSDQDLEAAVSAYHGELLPGFYEDWTSSSATVWRRLMNARCSACWRV
jgi:DNA-binding SARP family transcriptional activator